MTFDWVKWDSVGLGYGFVGFSGGSPVESSYRGSDDVPNVL